MKRPSHQTLHRIQSGENTQPAARWARLGLRAVTPAYWAAMRLNQASQRLRRRRVPRPVVSIGNLTTGGTGKTPMAVELVQRLQQLGHKPAVLLRGYGVEHYESKANSDEVEVLRNQLGIAVPVEPHPSRVKAARQVLRKHPETTCFVLDDGFQHRRIARNLDMVLIDATRPWGFGHLLPRGLLREPRRALRRADAVIVTRANRVPPEVLAELDRQIERYHGKPPIAHAAHRWVGFMLAGKRYPLDVLADKIAYGVSGIGNPGDFEQQLTDTAERCVGCTAFDDHHRYTRGEVAGVMHTAVERGANAVVTTEKDWVKWRKYASRVKLTLPVYRPIVAMSLLEGGAALDTLLKDRLHLGNTQP
jgi:tetraacyldisaccharide 4'-kinase